MWFTGRALEMLMPRVVSISDAVSRFRARVHLELRPVPLYIAHAGE